MNAKAGSSADQIGRMNTAARPRIGSASFLRNGTDRSVSGRANGIHAKLCGQGPRAEAEAARRLPPMTFGEPNGDLQRA
jgi:hypothetical protein